MARSLRVEIIGDSSSLERAYKRSSAAGKQWGQDVSHIGRGVAVAQVGFRGLGRSLAFASAGFLAGAGISAGIKAIVSDASDLNEQVNKSNVVFGKSASNIQAWSKTTANSFGIARSAGLEAAGGFGAILETSGIVEKDAAGMSKRLVELAGDMASFNNIDPSVALEKLRSGLVGEAEPLRTVGVLLSETRVAQEAYRLGLAKQGQALTDAQKVQARYSIILKDTARQQGDFARTSDGLANASRRVKASITDIAASIGSAVLPTLANATDKVADFLADFQKARGARAKLDFVIDFGRNLGRGAIDLVRRVQNAIDDELRNLDFRELGRTVFERVSDVLDEVDWGEIGRRVGERIKGSLDALAAFLQGIDWRVVGNAIVKGIADFLKGVDWVGLVKSIARFLLAALRAIRDLLQGIGDALAKLVVDGIKAGLRAGARLVEIAALKVALAIIKPLDFTILGRHIIPGLNNLITKIETKLAGLATSAEDSAGRVQRAVGDVGRAARVAPSAEELNAALNPPKTTTTPVVTVPPPVVVPDTTTKSTETKLEKAQKAFAKVIDALNFKAQQAEATRTLRDDIRAQEKINEAIRDEIKVEGRTTDLARQLFEGRQKLAELTRTAAQQRQFQALGLTAEGEERTPSSGSLLKRARSLQNAIKGTALDTPKTVAELRRIVAVLRGKFGAAGRDVRQAILRMLDDIASALHGGTSAQSGPMTKFAKRGVEGLVRGLGLTEEQVKEIRQRFSQFSRFDVASTSTGGRRSARSSGTNRTTGPFPADQPFVVNVYLDGKLVETTVTRRQQKKRGRNAPSRRGVRPGV